MDAIVREHPMANSEVTSFDQFRQFLKDVCGPNLTDHQIITLARVYQDEPQSSLDLNAFIAITQDTLRKANFEDFTKVRDQCIHYDGTG